LWLCRKQSKLQSSASIFNVVDESKGSERHHHCFVDVTLVVEAAYVCWSMPSSGQHLAAHRITKPHNHFSSMWISKKLLLPSPQLFRKHCKCRVLGLLCIAKKQTHAFGIQLAGPHGKSTNMGLFRLHTND
jgi:hypothetical protein